MSVTLRCLCSSSFQRSNLMQQTLNFAPKPRTAQHKCWMCALDFRRYSSSRIRKTVGTGRVRLSRGLNPRLVVKDTLVHANSEATAESNQIQDRAVRPPDSILRPDSEGTWLRNTQQLGLLDRESAGQSSSQNGIRIHRKALSIRKFPKAAPQYEHHTPSRDHTLLIRLEGRPLGEDEDFHEVLESALDAFKNLQLSASRKSTERNASDSVLSSGYQALSSTQATRPTNIVTSHHNLGTSQRGYSIKRTTIGPSRQYATATAQDPRRPPPPDLPNVLEDVSSKPNLSGGSIREHLRLWQEQHDLETKLVAPIVPIPNTTDASRNIYTQSGEDDSYKVLSQDEEAEDVAGTMIEPHTDDRTPTLLGTQKYLRRGDLVELVAGSEPLLAIFVRNIVGQQLQFYTIRGEWVNRRKTYIRFAIPGFVHPTELGDIMPYLPEEEIGGNRLDTLQPLKANAPRDVGANLIRKISIFQQAADSVFRRNADRLNRMYELIAPMNEGEGPRIKGLREIAMIVLQKKDPTELTQPMLCAVHRALIPLQNIVWVHSYDLRNPVFEIHSERTMREITQVRDWVRDYQEGTTENVTEPFSVISDSTLAGRLQNPISSFVQKARAAIAQSRLSRPLSASGAVGPSLVKVEPVPPASRVYREIRGQVFDDNDKAIIRYFDAWVASRYINMFTNLGSMGPMILRATGMYDNLPLSREIGFTFLKELGIITPWEDRSCYKLAGMRLPGHGLVSEETTKLQRKAQQWARRLLSGNPTDSAYKLEDSMATLRKDWDNLPVFCIDSADTLERDDGLSLQPVEGSSTEYWVHVHVANPSAFITQDSPIGRYAAQLSQSMYLPEHKYPMLPSSLTDGHFSLANGRPCLTFSARISSEGDILENAISSGIVRSVHYLTPNMVARALGLDVAEQSESISLLSVGGKLPINIRDHEKKTGEILEDGHVSILRQLFELSQAAYQKRISRSGLDFSSWRPATVMRPQVFLSEVPERPSQVNDSRVRQYEGDPIISLEVKPRATTLVNEMVAEFMITGGRVAASWCVDRNIPIPYRGIERDPEPRIQPEEFKKTLIDSKLESGFVKYVRLLGQAGASASPLEHVTLGLSAYCKATSPLRRYVDLYTHWQIEAALRYEAKSGTSLVGSRSDSYLPFSWAEVEERANTSVYREMRIRQLTAYSDSHWVNQALFRAFYFNQAPLPETFIVEVTFIAPGRQGFKVYMQWLTRNVFMEEKDATGLEVDCQEGDLWETRIKSIQTYVDRIVVEPIRLVKRRSGIA